MLKKIYTFICIVFLAGSLSGQTDTTVVDTLPKKMFPSIKDQSSQKTKTSKYPPKPKHVWEIGLNLGHFMIDGDVDSKRPFSGYVVGIHARRAIHYAFSLRFDLHYSQATGIEPQPYGLSLEPEPYYLEPDGTNRKVFAGYDRNNPWFPSYRTSVYHASVQGILNIGNILFHKERNLWNWYLILGVGGYHHRTMLDLRDGNNNEYTNLINRLGYTNEKFNTREGRKDIREAIASVYDGDYETEAFKKRGIFRLADKHNVHFAFTGGMGISRKINRRFNIALEHVFVSSDNDYLDGIRYRSNVDQTNNNDVMHYTSLRLCINLGNLKKKTEPLYWLNPLDAFYNDLAELKARPVYDPTDSDGDGVIDLLDQEPNSVSNAPVDTKGIAMDSDGDGVPDHKDMEPYSVPQSNVDEKGVAITTPKLTPDDVNKMIDDKLGQMGLVKSGPDGKKSAAFGPTDWFLPTIHFNLDEYCVKPQYYPQLRNVAEVMWANPDIKIVVKGHTDSRHTDQYNQVLSFNRAQWSIDYLVDKYKISRDRFVLQYSGETLPYGNHHYVNRRVEFSVAKSTDKEMERPAGPQAGDCMQKTTMLKTEESKDPKITDGGN